MDLLIEEFQAWKGPDRKIIELNGVDRDEEGKASVQFLIDRNQRFTLHCPTSYPTYQDDNFFVEASQSLQLWCNALNEFLLDSHVTLSLGTILDQANSLYSSKD